MAFLYFLQVVVNAIVMDELRRIIESSDVSKSPNLFWGIFQLIVLLLLLLLLTCR